MSSRPRAALAVGESSWRRCVSRNSSVVIPATTEMLPSAEVELMIRSGIARAVSEVGTLSSPNGAA